MPYTLAIIVSDTLLNSRRACVGVRGMISSVRDPGPAVAKEEDHDQRNEGLANQASNIAEDGRSRAQHQNAGLLNVGSHHSLDVILREVDPAPEKPQSPLGHGREEQREAALLSTATRQVLRGGDSLIRSQHHDDEYRHAKQKQQGKCR